jgi:hypothetical protein
MFARQEPVITPQVPSFLLPCITRRVVLEFDIPPDFVLISGQDAP